jgi:arsenite methyltransferase
MNDVREEVRERYAEVAARLADMGRKELAGASCCGSDAAMAESCCGPGAESSSCGGEAAPGSALYGARDTLGLPEEAVLASLGCGNPTAVAELHEGEVVLDLGSGGGIDVLLSARRVGPTGKVYGLDMTDEMLALALENKRKAGAQNVEFLKGFIEAVPLPASTIDVVISNCVINLAADKPAVFSEMYRVLKPGGRLGITDVVASSDLSAEERAERGSYVACIAGALSFTEYESGLGAAGFTGVDITPTHEVADGMFSAIVRATRP